MTDYGIQLLTYFNNAKYIKVFMENNHIKYVNYEVQNKMARMICEYYKKYERSPKSEEELDAYWLSLYSHDDKEIQTLFKEVFNTTHEMSYSALIDILKEQYIDREYAGILNGAGSLESTVEKLDLLQREKTRTNQEIIETIHENTDDKCAKALARKHIKPMATRNEHLNTLLSGGFIHGCYYIIAGSTGTGKTRLAMSWVNDLVEKGYSGLFVSLEMEQAAIEAMYVAKKFEVDYNHFWKGTMEENIIKEIYETLKNDKTDNLAIRQHINSKEPMTPALLEAELEDRLRITPIDFIVIDFLTLMKMNGFGNTLADKSSMYASVSWALHDMAEKHKIAIVALVQTGKPIRGQVGFELSDINKSWAMLEPAFFIGGIVRGKTSRELSLQVAKNRFGSLDVVTGLMDWQHNSWKETSAAETKEETNEEKKEHPF